MSQRVTGTVKWFNDSKGYGFLAVKDMPDVFAHYTQIQVDGFKTLAENEVVSFEIQEGTLRPTAINIIKEQK